MYYLNIFDISIYHFTDHTGGRVLIHFGIDGGMLFTEDSAVGSPYEERSYFFERSVIAGSNKDFGLAESWKALDVEFEHFLPLHGKPQVDLDEDQAQDILRRLAKDAPTRSL